MEYLLFLEFQSNKGVIIVEESRAAALNFFANVKEILDALKKICQKITTLGGAATTVTRMTASTCMKTH